MSKEKMKFWITCPSCKRKFGIDKAVVLKYLKRVERPAGEQSEPQTEPAEAPDSPAGQRKAAYLLSGIKECPNCGSENVHFSMDTGRPKPKPYAVCEKCNTLIAYG